MGFFVTTDKLSALSIKKGMAVNKKYIGVTAETVKRPVRFYQYALVGFEGSISIAWDVDSASKYDSEDEAMMALRRSSMWVCEYDGENVKPLQPTRR